jgi:hypothetical protein
MGSARDKLVDKAQAVAQDTIQKVQQATGDAMQRVQEVAGDVQSRVEGRAADSGRRAMLPTVFDKPLLNHKGACCVLIEKCYMTRKTNMSKKLYYDVTH